MGGQTGLLQDETRGGRVNGQYAVETMAMHYRDVDKIQKGEDALVYLVACWVGRLPLQRICSPTHLRTTVTDIEILLLISFFLVYNEDLQAGQGGRPAPRTTGW